MDKLLGNDFMVLFCLKLEIKGFCYEINVVYILRVKSLAKCMVSRTDATIHVSIVNKICSASLSLAANIETMLASPPSVVHNVAAHSADVYQTTTNI